MFSRLGLLLASLLLVLSLGFLFGGGQAEALVDLAPTFAPAIALKEEIPFALKLAKNYHSASALLAISFDFEKEHSKNGLKNYYFLFGERGRISLVIEPLRAWKASEVGEELLKLPYALEEIDTSLLKIWPGEALLIAANNGGSDLLRGGEGIKTNLVLLNPQNQLLAWYLSSYANSGQQFKLVINASSGTVVES